MKTVASELFAEITRGLIVEFLTEQIILDIEVAYIRHCARQVYLRIIQGKG